MNEKIIQKTYDILKGEARRGNVISYGMLYDMIGVDNRSPMDRKRGTEILVEVENRSMAEKGVMIGAIVVLQEEQIPGKMFFVLAEKSGKLKPEASQEEKAEFWKGECAKVYEAYRQ